MLVLNMRMLVLIRTKLTSHETEKKQSGRGALIAPAGQPPAGNSIFYHVCHQ